MQLHPFTTMLAALAAGVLGFAGCGSDSNRGTNDEVRPAGVSTPAGGAEATAESVTASDRDFVTRAAQDGRLEVELGELAQEKASKDAVQQFGKQMVTDHTQANRELEQVAKRKNIALPADIGQTGAQLRSKLEGLSGEAFDREYVRAMVEDHEKAVDAFRRQAESSGDPELKQLASKTLPTLQQHLDHARQLAGGERPDQAGSQEPGAADNNDVPTVNAQDANDTNQLRPPATDQAGPGMNPPGGEG